MILKYKNISVFYQDEGHGEAVILLHGFLENSFMWKDIKPTLLKKNRVITIDLLGHGQTNALGYIHTMSDMADAVLAVLHRLKLRHYVLIGHSMGGYVGLTLAKKKPSAILGLCLMNSTYQADDQLRKSIRKRAIKMAQTNYNALVRMSFANLFSEDSKDTHKVALDLALNQALLTPVQGYIAAQEGMLIRADQSIFFKALVAKKMIIIGKKDPVVNGKILLKDTLDTDIVCEQLFHGHMSHIESLYELTYLLKRFIE